MELPILYSFRRCPYAIRARMSLAYSRISYEHREILLKNRPKSLFQISSKGTVPVLKLDSGKVIDESIDIMKWALKIDDKHHWYDSEIKQQDRLIENNDGLFKKCLDRYKYHIRFPEKPFEDYQIIIGEFLHDYNIRLESNPYLMGGNIRLVDIAIMPFIRQCANVDLEWFNNEFYNLEKWLSNLISSELFQSVMNKYDPWEEESKGILIKWE